MFQTEIIRIENSIRSFITTLVFLAALFCSSAVFSQQENSDEPADDAELTAFRDWVLQCPKDKANSDVDCVLFYRVLLDNGYPLLVFQVTRSQSADNVDDENGQFVVVLDVPLGVFLPAGISISVDDVDFYDLGFERCDQNGCYAGTLLSPQMLSSFKKGMKARISFVDVASQKITATVSLSGFTSGVSAL